MTPSQSQILLEIGEQSDLVAGSTGMMKLLDLRVDGIVAQRVRHVIKRYLRRVGFTRLKVRHVSDASPFALRLLVEGWTGTPLGQEQLTKLKYLHECLAYVLRGGDSGMVPHPSKADGELLRQMLAKVEPHLNKVYYTRT